MKTVEVYIVTRRDYYGVEELVDVTTSFDKAEDIIKADFEQNYYEEHSSWWLSDVVASWGDGNSTFEKEWYVASDDEADRWHDEVYDEYVSKEVMTYTCLRKEVDVERV